MSEVYLKNEGHLKAYEKLLVLQASSMETARVGNVIQSVAHAQGVSIETLAERPRPLPFFYKVEQDECKGRGGEGGSKSCGACTNVFQGDLQGRNVPKLGHSCVLAMIYAGKDATLPKRVQS